MKQIKFGKEAREAIQRGIDIASNSVKVTLGPKGRNVILEQPGRDEPLIINDGATILRSICDRARKYELKDKFENIGAQLVRSASVKTESSAGDGTTTSAILTQALITEGLKAIEEGVNPVILKQGIENGVKLVVERLKSMSRPVSPEDLVKVATMSSEDPEIGGLIADVLNKHGKDAVITVEDSSEPGISVEMIEGYKIEQGYLHPAMMNKPERAEAVLENPYILLLDRKLALIPDLLPIVKLMKEKVGVLELLIIAESVEGDALATILLNKVKTGAFHFVCVKAPGYGNMRADGMEDIAIFTGATVVSGEMGMKLDEVNPEMLGRAKRVVVKDFSTEILGGFGDKEEIAKRTEQLSLMLENAGTDYEKKLFRERIGLLNGIATVLKVGYNSLTETNYKKLKIEDTVYACKAALDEGLVPGGGYAYIKSVQEILIEMGGEMDKGVEIVLHAIQIPLKILSENAGFNAEEVLEKVRNNFVFNALTGGYEKPFEGSILDPLKVERLALENSVSIAKTFLTSEVAIVNEEEIQK